MTYIDYLFVFGLFGIFAAANYLQNKAMYNSQKDADLADLRKQKDELEVNLHRDDKKYITPIRLQAYERAVLFLERISPQSMIFRIQMPGMNVLNLQTAMLQNIRDEFEHNIAQQLYISSESWSMVKTAKEEIVKMVNTAASKVNSEQAANELSKEIFALMMGKEKLITERAINVLKKDIQTLF